jgi:hypothetical protein
MRELCGARKNATGLARMEKLDAESERAISFLIFFLRVRGQPLRDDCRWLSVSCASKRSEI